MPGKKATSPTAKPTASRKSAAASAEDALEFAPYKGLGPLRFGMSPEEVREAMGPPDETRENKPMQEIREKRGSLELFYDLKKRKLECIDAAKSAKVSWQGKDLFGDKEAYAMALAADPGGREGNGYREFPKLGMLMGGFGKKKVASGKFIMFFSKAKASAIGNMTVV